jgi:hypothetical protein
MMEEVLQSVCDLSEQRTYLKNMNHALQYACSALLGLTKPGHSLYATP